MAGVHEIHDPDHDAVDFHDRDYDTITTPFTASDTARTA